MVRLPLTGLVKYSHEHPIVLTANCAVVVTAVLCCAVLCCVVVCCRGSQYRVESMLVRLAHSQNYLTLSPNKEQVGAFRGGDSPQIHRYMQRSMPVHKWLRTLCHWVGDTLLLLLRGQGQGLMSITPSLATFI